MAVQIVGADNTSLLAIDSATGAARTVEALPALVHFKLNSAATTNAQVLKASPGKLFSLVVGNNAGTLAYLKFYDKATTPVVGTDIPILAIPVPANDLKVLQFRGNYPFLAGISIAMVTGGADTDTTAVAAGQLKCMIQYDA